MKFKLFAVAVTVLMAINLDAKAQLVTFDFNLPEEPMGFQPLTDTTAIATISGDEFTLQVVENSAGAALFSLSTLYESTDRDDFSIVVPGSGDTITFKVFDSSGGAVNFSLRSVETIAVITRPSVAGTLDSADVFGPTDLGPSPEPDEFALFTLNSGTVDSIVFTNVTLPELQGTGVGVIDNIIIDVASVPEPSSLAVLMLCGAVAGARRRR